MGSKFRPCAELPAGKTIGTGIAFVAPRMELDAALRSEVAKLWEAMDVALPARRGWLVRVAAFLRGMVV